MPPTELILSAKARKLRNNRVKYLQGLSACPKLSVGSEKNYAATAYMKTFQINIASQWVALLCWLVPLHRSAAQFVNLTSEIAFYQWGTEPRLPWVVRCIVGTNSWVMQGDFLSDAKTKCWFTGNSLVMRSDLACHTTDLPLISEKHGRPGGLSSFVQVATPSGLRWTRKLESSDGNPGRGAHKADFLTLPGRVAWLAFCSSPCLKRPGRKLFPPSGRWKELIPSDCGFLDKTTTFEDPLALPQQLNLYAANGQPILQYRVTVSTNVVGWRFPLEFYVVQYRPAHFPSSNQLSTNAWELEFMARGKVTSIGPGAKLEIPVEVEKTGEQ